MTTSGGQIGKLNAPGAQAIPRNTADLVTYALEGVVSHGTGTAAYFGRPVAGKTGTAEDYKDAWFCLQAVPLPPPAWPTAPPVARDRGSRLRPRAARAPQARAPA